MMLHSAAGKAMKEYLVLQLVAKTSDISICKSEPSAYSSVSHNSCFSGHSGLHKLAFHVIHKISYIEVH